VVPFVQFEQLRPLLFVLCRRGHLFNLLVAIEVLLLQSRNPWFLWFDLSWAVGYRHYVSWHLEVWFFFFFFFFSEVGLVGVLLLLLLLGRGRSWFCL